MLQQIIRPWLLLLRFNQLRLYLYRGLSQWGLLNYLLGLVVMFSPTFSRMSRANRASSLTCRTFYYKSAIIPVALRKILKVDLIVCVSFSKASNFRAHIIRIGLFGTKWSTTMIPWCLRYGGLFLADFSMSPVRVSASVWIFSRAFHNVRFLNNTIH